MNVDLSEDQQIFDDAARSFLDARMSLTAVRGLYDDVDGFDRAWWREAAELGWTALFVPEHLGGGSVSGSPAADAAIVAEEIGRTLAPGPFLPVNVVAAAVAWSGSPEQQANLLPTLLSGETIATWALAEPGDIWDADRLTTSAVPDGDELIVNGEKAYVEAVGVADVLLVTAATGAGMTQVLVPRATPGVTVSRGRSVDVTRRFGRVAFDDVRVSADASLGEPGGAGYAVARQLQLALVLQCAETVGVVDRVLEITVEYAKERVAFGRPIGSFQALKHRFADHAMWLEAAKAVTDHAAAAVQLGAVDAAIATSLAKSHVGRSATEITRDCVQIHGGIGVTWEHDLHLYVRRAVSNEALWGTPAAHHERLCDLAGV
jgi:alkylation response protein AidB-like acyl-CoA dehydrogenase